MNLVAVMVASATTVPASAQVTADLVVAGLIVWAMWRQLRPQLFRPGRQVVVPAVLILVSLEEFGRFPAFTLQNVTVLAVTVAFAFVAGYWRASVARLERRNDGSLWVTGGWGSLVIYATTIGLHLGLESLMGESANYLLVATAPLYLAALFAGRLLGLWPRARRLGSGAQ